MGDEIWRASARLCGFGPHRPLVSRCQRHAHRCQVCPL